jgi:hypothetical protein
MLYQLCRLNKRTHTRFQGRLEWIPKDYAVKGREVKLKNGKEWESGWTVEYITPAFSLESELINKGRSYLKETTGIC